MLFVAAVMLTRRTCGSQLGLVEGPLYSVDIFMAQRHQLLSSQLQIISNFDLLSGLPAADYCAAATTLLGSQPEPAGTDMYQACDC